MFLSLTLIRINLSSLRQRLFLRQPDSQRQILYLFNPPYKIFLNPDAPAVQFKLYLAPFPKVSISDKLSLVFEMNVNILSLLFFASFVYPVAPEDGTGAPLRETFLASVYPG